MHFSISQEKLRQKKLKKINALDAILQDEIDSLSDQENIVVIP